MLWEITDKLTPRDLGALRLKTADFPFETALRLAPAALLALYFSWKYSLFKRLEFGRSGGNQHLDCDAECLPYWLAPQCGAISIAALSFFALVIAWPIWQAGSDS